MTHRAPVPAVSSGALSMLPPVAEIQIPTVTAGLCTPTIVPSVILELIGHVGDNVPVFSAAPIDVANVSCAQSKLPLHPAINPSLQGQNVQLAGLSGAPVSFPWFTIDAVTCQVSQAQDVHFTNVMTSSPISLYNYPLVMDDMPDLHVEGQLSIPKIELVNVEIPGCDNLRTLPGINFDSSGLVTISVLPGTKVPHLPTSTAPALAARAASTPSPSFASNTIILSNDPNDPYMPTVPLPGSVSVPSFEGFNSEQPSSQHLDVIPGKINRKNNIKYLGCFFDTAQTGDGRSLQGSQLTSQELTPDTCRQFCSGFKFYGLQYGQECFCGDELKQGAVVMPETDCHCSCVGDNAQSCGGDWRLSLYENIDDAPDTYHSSSQPDPVVSLDCSTSLASLATSASIVSTSVVVDTALMTSTSDVPSTVLIDCSSDASPCSVTTSDSLSLTTSEPCLTSLATPLATVTTPVQTWPILTPVSSLEFVPTFSLAATFPRYSVLSTSQVPIPTELSQISSRTEVSPMATSTANPRPDHPITDSQDGLHGFVLDTCAVEPASSFDGGGVFGTPPHSISKTMTIHSCASTCHGFAYFGIRNGIACFCGNEVMPLAYNTDGKQCNVPCSGQPGVMCGAPDKLSFYRQQGLMSPFFRFTPFTPTELSSEPVKPRSTTVPLSTSTISTKFETEELTSIKTISLPRTTILRTNEHTVVPAASTMLVTETKVEEVTTIQTVSLPRTTIFRTNEHTVMPEVSTILATETEVVTSMHLIPPPSSAPPSPSTRVKTVQTTIEHTFTPEPSTTVATETKIVTSVHLIPMPSFAPPSLSTEIKTLRTTIQLPIANELVTKTKTVPLVIETQQTTKKLPEEDRTTTVTLPLLLEEAVTTKVGPVEIETAVLSRPVVIETQLTTKEPVIEHVTATVTRPIAVETAVTTKKIPLVFGTTTEAAVAIVTRTTTQSRP